MNVDLSCINTDSCEKQKFKFINRMVASVLIFNNNLTKYIFIYYW